MRKLGRDEGGPIRGARIMERLAVETPMAGRALDDEIGQWLSGEVGAAAYRVAKDRIASRDPKAFDRFGVARHGLRSSRAWATAARRLRSGEAKAGALTPCAECSFQGTPRRGNA